jgi:hypothetical protein
MAITDASFVSAVQTFRLGLRRTIRPSQWTTLKKRPEPGVWRRWRSHVKSQNVRLMALAKRRRDQAWSEALTMTRESDYTPFGGRRREPPIPILVQRLWRVREGGEHKGTQLRLIPASARNRSTMWLSRRRGLADVSGGANTRCGEGALRIRACDGCQQGLPKKSVTESEHVRTVTRELVDLQRSEK